MRTRLKDKKNFIKVGMFISGLTLILMIMVVSIGKENSIFDSKVEVKALVSNVSNLKRGSYVELKGIRIGSVNSIQIVSEDEVEISMEVLEKELQWIKQDSRVAISTAGLVGDKFVEIFKGSKNSPIFDPEKDTLRSDDFTDIKKILNKGDNIATTTEKILNKLDLILENLGDGKIIVDTVHSLNNSAKNLEKITTDVNKANMGKMITSVNSTMASLDNILKRVEKGPGTLNSLVYNDDVYEDLRTLLGGAQRNKVIKYFIRESIKKADDRNKDEK